MGNVFVFDFFFMRILSKKKIQINRMDNSRRITKLEIEFTMDYWPAISSQASQYDLKKMMGCPIGIDEKASFQSIAL